MRTTPNPLTRRRLFEAVGTGVLGASLPELAVGAQSTKPAGGQVVEPLNRFPRMVQEYFVEQVRQAEKKSTGALAALKTKAEAEAHIRLVREKIHRCFGPLPE